MLLYTCIHGGNYKLGSVFGHVCVEFFDVAVTSVAVQCVWYVW